MRLHRNAKLGLAGRYALVRAIEGGCSIREAARRHGVSPATACSWWHRWREASEEERRTLACLLDRSSRPHRSPRLLSAFEQARICRERRRSGHGPRPTLRSTQSAPCSVAARRAMRVRHLLPRTSSPSSRISRRTPSRAYDSRISTVPSTDRWSVAITKSTPAFRWNATTASTMSAWSRVRRVITSFIRPHVTVSTDLAASPRRIAGWWAVQRSRYTGRASASASSRPCDRSSSRAGSVWAA